MLVYHNDGNGHFTEVSHKLGLDKPAKALGIAMADYDRDGRMDLFVSNDSMPEFLFHQKPDGTFEEVGLESEVAVNAEGQTFAGMGVDFADYDNDGWPDIVVTDLANQTICALPEQPRWNLRLRILAERYRRDVAAPLGLEPALLWITTTTAGRTFLSPRDTTWTTSKLVSPMLRYREPMMLLRNTGQEVCGCFLDLGRHLSGCVGGPGHGHRRYRQ